MKICTKVYNVKPQGNYYVISTDGVELRLWFLPEDILRIRAGFDGDWDEASYSLVMTAWESRTDSLLKDCRRRVETLPSRLLEEEDLFVISSKHLRVEIHKDPFLIRVYEVQDHNNSNRPDDKKDWLLHEDIPDLAFREDSNGRRFHTSRIEEGDAFYGFGEQTGDLNKAGESLVLSPGDSMGYDARTTEALYKHIPFYIRLQAASRRAIGYYYDCTADCCFNMGRQKRNYWHRYSTFETDAGDIDLFLIPGPSIRDVIRRYTDLTGKSVLLPRPALGYLGSSMYYSELPEHADQAILQFIRTARKEGIPIDGFQLSSGYCAVETKEGIKRCTFTWNRARFEDPAKWFREMKALGIKVSANVKPGMLLVHPLLEEMQAKGMFVRRSQDSAKELSVSYAIGTWWGGKGMFVDFTQESTRRYWKEYIRRNLLEYGCESIWNDNCEYDSLVDQDSIVSFEGKGGTIGKLRCVMSNIMCQLSNEAMLEARPDVRPFTVCRSGHAGIQRYAQTWAGDNRTSWETLRYNIATILGMGLSGVANEGCDIGGFSGPAPEPELLVRWVQNGIFQPRFSIHSTNNDNTVTEPWMYPEMTSYIRDAIRLRYRLSPYLYSLMARAHETGLPIMEAMVMAFQDDPAVWDDGVDFMLGDHLMICNVVEKGAKTRRIYFPVTYLPTIGKIHELAETPGNTNASETSCCGKTATANLVHHQVQDNTLRKTSADMSADIPGDASADTSAEISCNPAADKRTDAMRFYDFCTREEYLPGQTIEKPVTLETIPMFLTSGAIIPMAINQPMSLSRDPVTALDLLMAPDIDSSFTLYEDDGSSNDYQKGIFLRTGITVHVTADAAPAPGSITAVLITFVREGTYHSPVQTMQLDLIHHGRAPLSVTFRPLNNTTGHDQASGHKRSAKHHDTSNGHVDSLTTPQQEHPLPHYLYQPEFEASAEGWYYNLSLQTVQIRYSNPDPDYQIQVSFATKDLIGM